MERVRPFSCGSQFMDWQGSNCERCVKGSIVIGQDPSDMPECALEHALAEAAMDDGTILPGIALRIGATEDNRFAYVWKCNEVVWTEEWKHEWELLRSEDDKGRGINDD